MEAAAMEVDVQVADLAAEALVEADVLAEVDVVN